MHNTFLIQKSDNINICFANWCTFYGHGDEDVIHCDNSCLVSGSELHFHVSLPVTMFLKKLSPAPAHFRKSEATERWCSFYFTVSSHVTNFADTHLKPKCLVKIPLQESEEIPCSLATSLMVSLLFALTKSCTFATTSSF